MASKKICPTCGEERFCTGRNEFLCVVCDEYKMKIKARDALRKNKKNIELGRVNK